MIAKARLDALTDGIFAVAMTLLVIDLRFPQDLHPGSDRELLSAIGHLLWSGPFIAYLVSFFVIGVRWRTISRLGGTRAHVGKTFVRWSWAATSTSRPRSGSMRRTRSWRPARLGGWCARRKPRRIPARPARPRSR